MLNKGINEVNEQKWKALVSKSRSLDHFLRENWIEIKEEASSDDEKVIKEVGNKIYNYFI